MQEGDVLQDRYLIERPLGRGGMGGVWLGTQRQLGHVVAIKEVVIPPPPDDRAIIDQFTQEAKILCGLEHPGLPRYYDFFEHRGNYYLVMHYIEGATLQDNLIKFGSFSEQQILDYARQLCEVLQYLHTRKPPIIFRDIKPSNVMVREDNSICLIDFGIAKITDPNTGLGTQVIARNSGTPGFAAPEQYGAGSDVRTDIYSLGATLYYLLGRKIPPPAVALASGADKLIPLRTVNPDVTERTARVVERMMDLNRDRRPQSAREVLYLLGLTEGKVAQARAAASRPSPGTPVCTPEDVEAAFDRLAEKRLESGPDTASQPPGRAETGQIPTPPAVTEPLAPPPSIPSGDGESRRRGPKADPSVPSDTRSLLERKKESLLPPAAAVARPPRAGESDGASSLPSGAGKPDVPAPSPIAAGLAREAIRPEWKGIPLKQR
ncbi:MAG: serine/threonine protein kinase, partial [Candidatus Xenobia bacterium]